MSAAVCSFDTLQNAVDTAIAVIQSAIPVARIELVDDIMMRGINSHSKLGYREAPTLFFEFHGSETGVAEQAETAETIAADHGGRGFEWAKAAEQRSRLWHARDNTLYAGLGLRPGARAMITDVCVPVSRLAECLTETRKDADASGLVAPIVGHVGDGNFHMLILIDPAIPTTSLAPKALHARMVARAIAMEGTCTGEHGIGLGKIGFLVDELGDAVDVMRSIRESARSARADESGKDLCRGSRRMSMALPIEGLAPRKNIAPPLLELRGISKEFPGVKALDDVSFAIWPGEVHMLLGENGAGKSSLMKVLCGAYSADSGEFNYKGERVAIASTADAQKLGIAVIFQEFSLVPHLDIAQNIFLGREPKGRVPGTIGRRRILADAQRVLDSIGFDIDPSIAVHKLGVAQRQMVEIAKAISQNARILVMDEPTAALSDRETELLFELIARLKSDGVAIVYHLAPYGRGLRARRPHHRAA